MYLRIANLNFQIQLNFQNYAQLKSDLFPVIIL